MTPFSFSGHSIHLAAGVLKQTVIGPLLVLLVIGIGILVAYLILRRLAHSYAVIRFSDIVKTAGVIYAIKTMLKEIRFYFIRSLKKLIVTHKIFIDRYYVEDNAEVVLYTGYSSSPSSNYQPQQPMRQYDLSHSSLKVSLIATVRNEGSNVKAWANSVFNQTRLPNEIIITDAGSTDGTIELLKEISNQCPIPFHIIVEPGVNIAKGRNLAIAKAQFNIIATTDFGCRLHPDWLEKILTPFELDHSVEVIAGMYRAVDRKGNKLDRRAWWTDNSLTNPKWFLPSARSSSFTKEIWKSIGGYPEWLTMTGEDTYFALELKKYANKWALVPEAIAEWHAPDTTLSYWQKLYNWSIGEGESGLYALSYWKLTLEILFLFLLGIVTFLFQAAIWVFPVLNPMETWVYLLLAAWFFLFIIFTIHQKISVRHLFLEIGGMIVKIFGFIHGAKRQREIDQKRNESVNGTFFILSGIPIDDTGGGARCTQIALELLRRKYAVVFINKFPKYESSNLDISIKDANLYTYQISELDWDRFSRDYRWLLNKDIIGAIIEMPIGDFIPVINNLRDNGGVIIYDLLDDWNTQLGGNWYSEEVETKVIQSSQILLATTPILAERLSPMSPKQVELLPNAVNTLLFNPDRYYERPSDLPEAEWTVIYVGALWGEWLDWNLLIEVAKKYPDASVVVIGDYKGQCPQKLPNLHFLGLKPQKAIPAYLAYSNVSIIPWKVNKITQATSPLKVYEYLAMGKPIVSPEINPLKGIPGVFLARDQSDFIDLVGEVRKTILPREFISRFIMENNWQARVDRLLDLIHKIK
jgi:glycosyltransferase involved in cell wall biosynthesis/cellulose synthase/poly-beta-1,6-N-acetylglucosamine synthase-like glycosyltransferase